MKFRNFTPHTLIVFEKDSNVIFEEESEGTIRLNEEITRTTTGGGSLPFPVVNKDYGQSNLPSFEIDTFILVSKMVLDAYPERWDLLCPDTGPDSAIRDADGNIIGVQRIQAQNIDLGQKNGWRGHYTADGIRPVFLVDAAPECAIFQVGGRDDYYIVRAETPGDIHENDSFLTLAQAHMILAAITS